MRGKYGEYINSDTGEITEGYLVERDKERDARMKRGLRRRDEIEGSIREMTAEMGEFYFSNYGSLIKAADDDTALAFRFLYLCTYMGYDGYIRDWHGDKVRMDDLNRIFGLNLKPFYQLKDKLIQSDFICADESGNILVNEDFSIKGSVKGTACERDSIKVYDRGIQEIYLESKPREHTKIGKIVKVLPYINIDSNVICAADSIYETDVKKIKRLSTSDMCDILGLDRSNVTRIRKYLLKVRVGDRGLLGCFQYLDSDYYIVNPYVFYHGTNIEGLRGVMRLFDTGSERNGVLANKSVRSSIVVNGNK